LIDQSKFTKMQLLNALTFQRLSTPFHPPGKTRNFEGKFTSPSTPAVAAIPGFSPSLLRMVKSNSTLHGMTPKIKHKS
jgi:hypothetical protein